MYRKYFVTVIMYRIQSAVTGYVIAQVLPYAPWGELCIYRLLHKTEVFGGEPRKTGLSTQAQICARGAERRREISPDAPRPL